MLGILAGILIGIGALVYLSVGGVPGAVLFATGLIAIINFKLHLFTGRAGKLGYSVSPKELTMTWFENLIGAFSCAIFICLTPIGDNLFPKAMDIVALRNANGPITNLILGIGCGILMYVATNLRLDGCNSLFQVTWPVATFILIGFNHCVADMFYISLGCVKWSDWLSLIPTTIGNVIGCQIIPRCTLQRDN